MRLIGRLSGYFDICAEKSERRDIRSLVYSKASAWLSMDQGIHTKSPISCNFDAMGGQQLNDSFLHFRGLEIYVEAAIRMMQWITNILVGHKFKMDLSRGETVSFSQGLRCRCDWSKYGVYRVPAPAGCLFSSVLANCTLKMKILCELFSIRLTFLLFLADIVA